MLRNAQSIHSIELLHNTVVISFQKNETSLLQQRISLLKSSIQEEYFDVNCITQNFTECTYEIRPIPEIMNSESIAKEIKKLPCIQDYLNQSTARKFSISDDNGDESLAYVRVFEEFSDHTATFDWYSVNKYSGEIKAMFNKRSDCNK